MFSSFKSLWKSVAESPSTPPQGSQQPSSEASKQPADPGPVTVVPAPAKQIPVAAQPPPAVSSSPTTNASGAKPTSSFSSLTESLFRSSLETTKKLLGSGGAGPSGAPVASSPLATSESQFQDPPLPLTAGVALAISYENALLNIHQNHVQLASKAEAADNTLIKCIGQCNFMYECFTYFNEQLEALPAINNSVEKMKRDVEAICWRIDELEILLNERMAQVENAKLNQWKEDQLHDLADYRKQRKEELELIEKELTTEQLRRQREWEKYQEQERIREQERQQREERERAERTRVEQLQKYEQDLQAQRQKLLEPQLIHQQKQQMLQQQLEASSALTTPQAVPSTLSTGEPETHSEQSASSQAANQSVDGSEEKTPTQAAETPSTEPAQEAVATTPSVPAVVEGLGEEEEEEETH